MRQNGKDHGNHSGGEEPPERKGSIFTTLVFDGDASTTDPLEAFLKREGHTVLTASSSQDAVVMTRRFQPDMIVLDCENPEAPCLELLPKLLAEDSGASVVLVARNPRTVDVVDGMRMGAAEYFDRPIDLDRLKKVIDLQKEMFRSEPRI